MKLFGLSLVVVVLFSSVHSEARERKLITDFQSYFHLCPQAAQACLPSIKVNGKAYFFDSAQEDVATQVNQTLAGYNGHGLRKTMPFVVTGFVRSVPNFQGWGPQEVFQITEIKGLLVPAP